LNTAAAASTAVAFTARLARATTESTDVAIANRTVAALATFTTHLPCPTARTARVVDAGAARLTGAVVTARIAEFAAIKSRVDAGAGGSEKKCESQNARRHVWTSSLS
jgi:hypothetical protein